MANVLNKDKQILVISALAEGTSIRSIERITGVHRDTIMRLGIRIGQGCARFLDRQMRDLFCERIQIDEIWGSSGKSRRMSGFPMIRMKSAIPGRFAPLIQTPS